MKRSGSDEAAAAFCEKRREFKNMSDLRYREYLQSLTNDFKTNPKRLWSFLKGVKGGKGGIHVLSDENGAEIMDDVQKANILNSSFASKFTDSRNVTVPDVSSHDLPMFTRMECDVDTVRTILSSIPVHKACGPDGVSARIVRECSHELSVPLAKICSLSLSQGTFPQRWKEANVPILKKGNAKDPKNYRSVSLIPLFGKVLERVAYMSLLRHVNPVLSPVQHGFVSGRSCATNLATLLSTSWDSIASGDQTDCIYTDFSAAFQSVNHSLLIHKLQNSFNVSETALSWFSSYLENRRQRVIVNGRCSGWCRVTSGTPEGGLISPLLFALYINDLPSEVSSRCLMFADDVKIYRRITCAADADLLQADLQRLCRWSETWKLSLNPAKCKSFRMTLKTKPILTTYFVKNTALEHVNSIQDLGVTLDTKLTFGPHIQNTVMKANRALGGLIRSFQIATPRGHFNTSAVLTSYFACVRSVLEFCSVIWGGAAAVHTDRVDRVQHRFLMWLNAHSRSPSTSMSYADLLKHFRLCSLAARRTQHEILFARNVLTGKISSSFLLSAFSLSTPIRSTRQQVLMYVPYARVSTVKGGLFVRLPGVVNRFLGQSSQADIFHDSFATFRSRVIAYVCTV